jgi:hypothetical protein
MLYRIFDGPPDATPGPRNYLFLRDNSFAAWPGRRAAEQNPGGADGE